MGKTEKKEKSFGLIGKNISYSFSRGYFSEKFTRLKLLGYSYDNFDLDAISEFKSLISKNNLSGVNVTIPYKESIIPYLDYLDKTAKKIGAVNTIKFTDGGLKGYNTDAYGFKKAMSTHLKKHHENALILGTGGASKAISYVFERLDIPYKFVSRNPKKGAFSYTELDKSIIEKYKIIVNCSPVGTHPNILDKPNIPYQYIGKEHFLFDLIYNPEKTAFLKEGIEKGAAVENGLRMLQFQAEKAWKIWNA